MKFKNLIRIKNILLIMMLFMVALFITIEIKESEIEKLVKENKQLEVVVGDLEVTNIYLTTQNNDLTQKNKELHRYKEIYNGLEKINKQTDTRYYDIPLTVYQQELVQEVAESYELAETTFYGLMELESRFDANAISYNDTSVGIMQINKNSADFAAELAGLETYDLFKFEDNVKMGIALYSYYLNYYRSLGIDSQEELCHLALTAYNKGILGCNNYIKINGTSRSTYSARVLENKCEIEQTLQEGENE